MAAVTMNSSIFKTVYSTVFGDKAVGATEIGNIYDLEISNVLVNRKDNGNNAKITLQGQKIIELIISIGSV